MRARRIRRCVNRILNLRFLVKARMEEPGERGGGLKMHSFKKLA